MAWATLLTSCSGQDSAAAPASSTTAVAPSTTIAKPPTDVIGPDFVCGSRAVPLTPEIAAGSPDAAGMGSMPDMASMPDMPDMSGDSGKSAPPCATLPAPEEQQLEAELARTRAATAGLATLADAEAAGYVNPDIATDGDSEVHMVRWDRMDGTFDLDQPEQLLYEHASPDSPLVGVVYYVIGLATELPEGFVGPDDHWHRHDHMCWTDKKVRPLLVNDPADAQACIAGGGTTTGVDGWMLHVWAVTGWANALGVFVQGNNRVG